MTGAPKPLLFEVLCGCSWVSIRPEHVRAGDVFRLTRADGSPFLAAARVLSDIDDSGVYIARQDGSQNGVVFEAVQAVTVLTAPVLDFGD